MDTRYDTIQKQNEEYRAKLDANPTIKLCRQMAEQHVCPKIKHRIEKRCFVLVGRECRWITNPPLYLCEQCWKDHGTPK